MNIGSMFLGAICGLIAGWFFCCKFVPWLAWTIIKLIDPEAENDPPIKL